MPTLRLSLALLAGLAATLALAAPAAATPPRVEVSSSSTFVNARTDNQRPGFSAQAIDVDDPNGGELWSTWSCRMDGGPWVGCPADGDGPDYYASYRPSAPLAPGSHTFEVQGTSQSTGETGSGSLTFTVDVTPPDTSIVAGPGTTADRQPAFGFSSDDPDAAFECSFSSYETYVGWWFPCGGEQRGQATVRLPSPVRPGSHWIKVRAKDPFDRNDPSPVHRDFVVTGEGSGPAGLGGRVRSMSIPRQTLARVLQRWLTVDLQCVYSCAPRVAVALPRALARRLGLPVTIARGGGRRTDAGRLRVKLRFSARARRKLQGRRVLRITVRVTNAGATLTRTITLRR